MALSTLLARSVRRTSAARLACGALISVGCSGEVVNLGSSSLEAGGSSGAGGTPGGAAPHIWELPSEPLIAQMDGILLANPTLTEDVSELYYSQQQQQGVSPDPYVSLVEHAALIDGHWANGKPLTFDVLGMPEASSPAISLDGMELWVGMSSGSNTDIYRSARQGDAWTKPEPVAALNSAAFDDVPRPPGFGGTVMPLSSKRHGGPKPLYQIYLSKRDSSGAWSEPSQALLGNVNAAAFQSADGFLTVDGRDLYFSSTRAGGSDLYVAHRDNSEANFGEPEPLVDLNNPNGTTKPSEERMPWLSPAGEQLFFVSDRSGQYTLYVANKVR